MLQMHQFAIASQPEKEQRYTFEIFTWLDKHEMGSESRLRIKTRHEQDILMVSCTWNGQEGLLQGWSEVQGQVEIVHQKSSQQMILWCRDIQKDIAKDLSFNIYLEWMRDHQEPIWGRFSLNETVEQETSHQKEATRVDADESNTRMRQHRNKTLVVMNKSQTLSLTTSLYHCFFLISGSALILSLALTLVLYNCCRKKKQVPKNKPDGEEAENEQSRKTEEEGRKKGLSLAPHPKPANS